MGADHSIEVRAKKDQAQYLLVKHCKKYLCWGEAPDTLSVKW